MVWREDKNRDLEPLLIILLFLILMVGGVRAKRFLDSGIPLTALFTDVKLETKESYDDGRVIKGFPAYLLTVISDTKIVRSSRSVIIQKGKSNELLTTVFHTQAPPGDIYGGYAAILQEHSYFIPGSPGAQSGLIALGKENNITLSLHREDLDTTEVRIDVKNLTSTEVLP